MRPMCETRKRRHSDPQLLANKRLTNGKTDHVTTRSQAKNDSSSRVSPARKVKHKVLSTEERRLMISMRLRHEERNSTQASSLTNHQGQEETGRRHLKSSNRIHALNGGGGGRLALNSSPVKSSIRAGLRTKVLSSIMNEQGNEILAKSVQDDALALKRATEAEKRETRARKRRSALWVLNCEAEEFLFGETAAEDREVELPPISSPPKKRRRMRATELGDLLKETPLLESKLRHPPGFSESDEGSPAPSSACSNKKRKEKKSRGARTKNSSRVKRKLDMLERASSSISSSEPRDPFDPDDGSNSDFPNLSYALMLEVASTSITRTLHDPLSSEQSVRIQRILNSLEYTFSFENVPSSEVWYRTFSHQNRPRHVTFHTTTPSSVILPYEAKGLNRESKKRMRRPPRKSPRCHASTQAILSLLKPGRGRRSSGAVISPTPPVQPPPPSSKSKPTNNNASHIQETPVSYPSSSSSSRFNNSLGSHLLATITTTTTSAATVAIPPPQSPSLIAPNGIENGIKACDMTATQYLWDSIQFLSDPYVIHVLSHSSQDRGGGGKGRSQPVLNKVGNRLEKTWTGNSKRQVNHNNNVKTPLKLVIPSPKTSPRVLSLSSPTTPLQNGNCSNSELRRVLRSPPVSPAESLATLSPASTFRKCRLRKNSEVRDRSLSPPVLPRSVGGVHSESKCKLGPRTMPKLSPDITRGHVGSKCKSGSPNYAMPKLTPIYHLHSPPSPPAPKEEVLFSLDSLPDFPWETFY